MDVPLPATHERRGKGSCNDVSTQRLVDLVQALCPFPQHTYPAGWFSPAANAYHLWSSRLSTHAILLHRERVNALSARIPPELFDNILFHVNHQCIPRRGEVRPNEMRLVRRQYTESILDTSYPIKTCSLVCRRWANQCRGHLFSKAILIASSHEDVEQLITYATRGCPSLVPIHILIGEFWVAQRYDAPYSFCHRLHSFMQYKMTDVSLRLKVRLLGPVPDGCPLKMLNTPHWSIPPGYPTPPSLLCHYSKIEVTDVHLVSFSHVVSLVRTFHSQQSVSHPNGTATPITLRRPYSPEDVVIEATACRDNLRLCMYAATVRPSFIMHWMQDDEPQWIFSLMTSLEEILADEAIDEDRYYSRLLLERCVLSSDSDPHNLPGLLAVSWLLTLTYPNNGGTLELQFCFDRQHWLTPQTSFHVVGMEVYWMSKGSHPRGINIDAFISV
ncbi:hypothetical protein BC629DRAFT_1480231 [Irpex lacteus]|nr:hypothetical protein BC629DRAFT_1480231 [Irpex lacteus]